MIRMRKVRAVARFELTSTVRRVGYLAATFGMPLFVGAIGLLATWAARSEQQRLLEPVTYGVVDTSARLGLAAPHTQSLLAIPGTGPPGRDDALPESATITFQPYADETAAREALGRAAIAGYYAFGPDFLESGVVDAYFLEGPKLGSKMVRSPLNRMVLLQLVRDSVPAATAARVAQPIAELREWTVASDGSVSERNPWGIFAGVIIPVFFTVMLLASIMMSTSYLIQATAVEKENKVVEVLLSSANPDEILFGKLLGLGSAGLLQIAVWFSMVGVGGVLSAAALSAVGVALPWKALAVGLVFFVAGYLFYGSLMLGTGSLGASYKESQQWAAVWTILAVVPMLFLRTLIEEPHGLLARILSFVPFSSPLTVVLRVAVAPSGIGWIEIGGGLVTLCVATWLSIELGARLFRVGLLLSGGLPKLRELWRQADLR